MHEERIEALAQTYNYTPESFIDAIASGEIAPILLPDEQRIWVCDWLEEHGKILEDPSLQEAIQSIARQLRAAIARDTSY